MQFDSNANSIKTNLSLIVFLWLNYISLEFIIYKILNLIKRCDTIVYINIAKNMCIFKHELSLMHNIYLKKYLTCL